MKNLIASKWVLFLAFILFLSSTYFITDLSKWTINQYYKFINHPTNFDVSTTGQIGDTIRGTTGPFIALLAGFLTFIAFWVQFKANIQVQQQFKIQQFESQYFEMIRLHKENISEMRITGYSYLMSTTHNSCDTLNETITKTQIERVVEGRKTFVSMVKELNACLSFCKDIGDSLQVPDDIILKIGYRFFFFGSFSQLIKEDEYKIFIKECRAQLKNVRKEHKETFGGKKDFDLNSGKIDLHIKYAPFTGHESRLVHYYRHLFSTVKFVVKNEKEKLFDYDQSREYLKILRAQMSNDEQILLYHNYISGIGEDWESEENLFLSKYRMLHNLPIDRVKHVEKPRKHFAKKIISIAKKSNSKSDPMFEWADY
ncbi:putative phage abortive infection protein [Chryseobacterium tructae]|uniref:Phage abortive infection protein n=1 Tax=Chryseobacterium tructae TaxID=1037380 RepID=A0ABV7Y1A8_9FLAO|nr:putative phage abortive infection protein [Chryseobacterium tructae]MDN3694270.1 putative phage abortive infection protein [Chryseobacterium tructae]